MGIPFGQGFQALFDGQQSFLRSGGDCFLRVSNFAASGDFTEVGVPYVPTGNAAIQTGFTDILILPPPTSIHHDNTNLAPAGGKTMFGDRTFIVSDTFCDAMVDQYPGIQGKYNVFRNWMVQQQS